MLGLTMFPKDLSVLKSLWRLLAAVRCPSLPWCLCFLGISVALGISLVFFECILLILQGL